MPVVANRAPFEAPEDSEANDSAGHMSSLVQIESHLRENVEDFDCKFFIH